MSADHQVQKDAEKGSYSLHVDVDDQETPIAAPLQPPPPLPKNKRASYNAQLLPNSLWSALCPCIPAAQVASALGESYSIELVVFGGAFLGNAVAYYLSTVAISWKVNPQPALLAWLLFALSPLGTGAAILLILFVLVLKQAENEDDEPEPTHTTTIVMLGVTVVFQLVLMYKTARLRNKLHARAMGMSSGNAYSICCPCCSLTDMASIVKSQSQTSPCSIGPVDELPPYN